MEYLSDSYLDFAENDYSFFRQAYAAGMKGSPLAALAQNICERYLKHLIWAYWVPKTDTEMMEKDMALQTHSLAKLLHYIELFGIPAPPAVQTKLATIDGFFPLTCYPVSGSFFPSEADIDKAMDAVEHTRAFVYQACQSMPSCPQET